MNESDVLEWAACWIEGSLVGEENKRTIEFGKNMAMSIRAAKTDKSIFDTCPECGGCGEVAGAYYSGDGITTCDRCCGKGTI